MQKDQPMMSQVGQDSWVFGEVFNEMRGGYFLDLGAHDGIDLSNTYVLERQYGWTGLCVDANPETFQLLKKNRRVTCVEACLDAAEGFVDFARDGVMGGIVAADTDVKTAKGLPKNAVVRLKTTTLEKLLAAHHAPSEIDYLSIDLEGAEERVLGNFNFKKYRFKCITIERPTERLRTIFQENGYRLIKEIPRLDCFYIHESFSQQYLTNVVAFIRKRLEAPR